MNERILILYLIWKRNEIKLPQSFPIICIALSDLILKRHYSKFVGNASRLYPIMERKLIETAILLNYLFTKAEESSINVIIGLIILNLI